MISEDISVLNPNVADPKIHYSGHSKLPKIDIEIKHGVGFLPLFLLLAIPK